MLPHNSNTDDLILHFKEEKQNTKTFGLNMVTNCIGGTVDGLTALKQSIYLTLSTEADQFIIYPYTYGVKTLDLIGTPNHYVMAVLPNRIKEALLKDNRITDVLDFEFKVELNKLHVTFLVNTIYGGMKEEMVVKF